jgi:hypothetical protein
VSLTEAEIKQIVAQPLHKIAFELAWAAAMNRFTATFVKDFCHPNGSINWEALVQFNSGARV